MKRYQWTGHIALLCAVVLLLAGCGEEDEQQAIYRQYGITCMQEGRYEEAVEYFQKALDQSIGRVSAMETDICYYKAQAQYLNGDLNGAIETYTALINYSADAQACYLRGRMYYISGSEEEKLLGDKDFAAAVEKEPREYELFIGIYEAMDGQKNAPDYLRQALEIKGDKPVDHLQKGRICYLLGDNEKARDYLEQALEEEQVLANLYLTEVYQTIGDTASAEQTFQAYLNSGFVDADGLYRIGLLQMESGAYDRAVQCFETALGLDRVLNRQSLEKNRIVAYEYLGDFATAKKLAREYHKTYPQDTSLDRELTFLETR